MSLNIDPSEWRLSTEGGIPYKLLEGFPKGSVQGELSDHREQYIIRVLDFNAFMVESFPPMLDWGGGIWEHAPNRLAPGSDSLRTRKVDYEPFDPSRPCDFEGEDPDAPGETYGQFLKLAIEYSNTDPIAEVTSDVTAEFLMIPVRSGAIWQPSGDVVEDMNVPAGKLVPGTEWTIRLNRVREEIADVIIGRARAAMGKVNTSVMRILKDAAGDTVLFLGYSTRQEYSWRSGNHLEMELKFLEKRVVEDGDVKGHNYFFRPDKGEFQLLQMDYNFVYEYYDLNTIADLNDLMDSLDNL